MAKRRNKPYIPPARYNPEARNKQLAAHQARWDKRLDVVAATSELRIRALEDFMALLSTFGSHDIKNAVHNLDGVINNLRVNEPLPSDDIADLKACVGMLRACLDDFAALSLQHLPGALEQFELLRLPTSLETLHRVSFKANGIQFQVLYEGTINKALLIPYPLHRLLLAVNNLFINATYAMRAEQVKRLLLEVATPAADYPYLRLRLSDTGEGVAQENRQRIFERHFSTRPGGTGVGLGHVKFVMDDVGGLLVLADTPSPGYVTTFELLIPLTPPDPEPADDLLPPNS